MARQQKRNIGPVLRTEGAVKQGMFRDESLQNEGFKSQVPTTPQNKDKPPYRRPGDETSLDVLVFSARLSANDGRSNSLRPHSRLGPAMTNDEAADTHGLGGNVDPSPASEATRIGNSRALKRAGIDAMDTRTYTNQDRFRAKR